MADAPSKRRDAVANAARVVAAAAEVFAERGLDAPIPEIAKRAGVGKATVYRNFPTKADLVMAIALDRMATIRGSVGRALEHGTPVVDEHQPPVRDPPHLAGAEPPHGLDVPGLNGRRGPPTQRSPGRQLVSVPAASL